MEALVREVVVVEAAKVQDVPRHLDLDMTAAEERSKSAAKSRIIQVLSIVVLLFVGKEKK